MRMFACGMGSLIGVGLCVEVEESYIRSYASRREDVEISGKDFSFFQCFLVVNRPVATLPGYSSGSHHGQNKGPLSFNPNDRRNVQKYRIPCTMKLLDPSSFSLCSRRYRGIFRKDTTW
jgi:hypothetical protein